MGSIASTLGAITVLTAGSIWRKRKLQNEKHPAAPAIKAAQRADLP
jgi:hypothetical protein